jgi:hypothetical protein
MNARVGVAVGLLLGAVVVILNPVGPARACSCMVTTVESSVADADAAFVGVATEELNVSLGPGVTDEFGGGPGSWAFDVVEVVKGELEGRVEVWQDMNGECGPIFEIGELIGVVVRRVGDRYVTSDCGGVWLPDELLAPGTLASPTGSGPVALVAAGRTGDAVLATYDADGNLIGWGLGEPGDILMRPRVCPGSGLLVGMRIGRDGTTSVVRWDLATLQQVSAVTLPPPATVGHDWADNFGMSCTSADGDVAFLLFVTAPAENVVVRVHGTDTSLHPIEEAWDFAVAPDLGTGYLLTGEHGTTLEAIVLNDGTRRPFAQMPEGLGGRTLAVDDVTGRVAVFASSVATSEAGDPPGVDRLVIFDSGGSLVTVASLEVAGQGSPGSVRWLDGDRLLAFWNWTEARVDVIGIDGSLESSFEPAGPVADGPVVLGDRLYLPTDDGVVSTALDGSDARTLQPGIARVVELAAAPSSSSESIDAAEFSVDRALRPGETFDVSFTGGLRELRGGQLWLRLPDGTDVALLRSDGNPEVPMGYDTDPSVAEMLDDGLSGNTSTFVRPPELAAGRYLLCTTNSEPNQCITVDLLGG